MKNLGDKAIIYDECLTDIMEHQETHWDSHAERVIASRQDRLGALVLEQQTIQNPDQETIKQALLDGIRQKGWQCLPRDKDTTQLQQRMAFLTRFNTHMDEPLPASDEASLLNTMEEWLMPFLDGMTRLEHLKKLSLNLNSAVERYPTALI